MDETIQMFEALKSISDKISEVKKEEEPKFNFFSAIVSGKRSREHIEAYHSNFIAYLLNPEQPHNGGNKFFNDFLRLLENVAEKNNKHLKGLSKITTSIQKYEVEREKPAHGNIDIFIHSPEKKWILFIENKVRSEELKDKDDDYCQIRDYCKWIEEEEQYKDWNWMGIFLTKDGHSPESIKSNEEYKNHIISISYQKIREWLYHILNLIKNDKLEFAINDYIKIIENELRINTMGEELEKYLNENISGNIIADIAANYKDLSKAIEEYIKKQRNNFLDCLVLQLIEKLAEYHPEKKEEKETNDRYIINCKKERKRFRIKIGQTYPKIEEEGQGLWWGIYPPIEHTFYDKPLFEKDAFWKRINLEDENGEFDDYEKETDRGSALIIKAMKDNRLRDKLLLYTTENIIRELRKAFDKIQNQ